MLLPLMLLLHMLSSLWANARPLPPPGGAEAVRALATDAMASLRETRRVRHAVPARVRPAFVAGWRAGAILQAALKDPEAVLAAPPMQSEFRRRGSLLWAAATGRW